MLAYERTALRTIKTACLAFVAVIGAFGGAATASADATFQSADVHVDASVIVFPV